MRDPSTFARITNTPVAATLRQLPDNSFWTQTQNVLGSYLLKAEYGPHLYIPVHVAPDKTLSEDMFDFLRAEGEPRCLLLVGQYGIGKTSAINDLRYRFLDDPDEWAWVYLDTNERRSEIAENPATLIEHLAGITSTVVNEFRKRRKLDRQAFYADVYQNDYAFARFRQFDPDPDPDQMRKTVEREMLKSVPLHLNVNLRFLVRLVGLYRVVLVIDNLDSQGPEVQIEGVKTASDLAASCKLKSIVPVRRTTQTELRYHHKDIFSPFVQTAVQPPDMIPVIRRRVEQAIQMSDAQEATLGEGALRAKVRDCPEFAEVLVQGLSASKVARLLNNLSNESVREALHFALHVYSSHFLDARRIIRRISPANRVVPSMWRGHLPYYMVLKALVLRNWPIYRPEVSWVGNAFGTSVPSAFVSPFLRIYMLSLLGNYFPNEMRLDEFTAALKSRLRLDEAAIELELKWLIQNDWVSQPDPAHLKMTLRGHFVRHILICDPEYLTHIATDVRMYPEIARRLSVPADTMGQRINNLLLLIEFLTKRECELLTEFARDGIAKFFENFGSGSVAALVVSEVDASIASIDIEDDEHREEVIKNAQFRLKSLKNSPEWNTVHRILARYR